MSEEERIESGKQSCEWEQQESETLNFLWLLVQAHTFGLRIRTASSCHHVAASISLSLSLSPAACLLPAFTGWLDLASSRPLYRFSPSSFCPFPSLARSHPSSSSLTPVSFSPPCSCLSICLLFHHSCLASYTSQCLCWTGLLARLQFFGCKRLHTLPHRFSLLASRPRHTHSRLSLSQ